MTKTLMISAILAFAPMLAQAECSWHQEQTAMTCAEGMTFDAEAGKCVETVG